MTELAFLDLMTKFAKQSGTTIESRGAGDRRHVLFTSHEGNASYTEPMPAFHEPGWAAWCALRLLHVNALHRFEIELQALFDSYKKATTRTWATYNDEKRVLLRSYLTRAYDPKAWK